MLGNSWALSEFLSRHAWVDVTKEPVCQGDHLRVTNEYDRPAMAYRDWKPSGPDPRKEDQSKRAELLARAQDAEAALCKIEEAHHGN